MLCVLRKWVCWCCCEVLEWVCGSCWCWKRYCVLRSCCVCFDVCSLFLLWWCCVFLFYYEVLDFCFVFLMWLVGLCCLVMSCFRCLRCYCVWFWCVLVSYDWCGFSRFIYWRGCLVECCWVVLVCGLCCLGWCCVGRCFGLLGVWWCCLSDGRDWNWGFDVVCCWVLCWCFVWVFWF